MKILLQTTLLLFFAYSSQAQIDLKNLDGNISSQEIKGLEILDENGTNQLLIDPSSDNYLKITVKSEELYVASLCICNEQDEVTVLHASAALGQILYKKEGDGWVTNQKFDWQLREVDMKDATIAKRNQYLQDNGWVANTMNMGNAGETEFIIDRKAFAGKLKLAIGLMTAENPNSIVGIPSDGAGDCADHKLVAGPPKTNYKFSPGQWLEVNE
ncbi:hypothetical protein [Ekhidna sp.]|uniref:hypothetical protein n=1 Tax=Ekhidna sp. TaxID=2608089 RepID=UPI0032ED4433